MKILLVFLLAAVVLGGNLSLLADKVQEEDPVVLMIRGFLEGVGETKNETDLLKCLNGIEDIIEEIKEAIKCIKEFTPEQIELGVRLLIDALHRLASVIKPCVGGYTVLEKLIKSISESKFERIYKIVLKHPALVFAYIVNMIKDYEKKKFQLAGRYFGQLLKLLYLDSSSIENQNRALEFAKAFLIAIGETGKINEIEKCLKDVEKLIADIKIAFELIKTKNPAKILEAAKLILSSITSFIKDIKPCSDSLVVLKKLIEAIANVKPSDLASKIIKNLAQIIGIIDTTIPCFSKGDYACIGKGLGTILKILFL